MLQWLSVDRLDPGIEFVLPSVPGTGHTAGGDLTFGDRPSLMSTHAVECMDFSLVPKDRQNQARNNDFYRVPLGNRVCLGHLDPLLG